MKVDIGVGYHKEPGYFGIDARPLPDVDLVCDVNNGIPLPDDSVDEVLCRDFLEHIDPDRRIEVITEIWRILKNGGIFKSHTPCALSQAMWQDPTHKCPWVQNSWLYYTDEKHRHLYGIKANFKVVSLSTSPLNKNGQAWVDAVLEAVK